MRRTLLLYDRLKERGYKYGTDYELPTLGVLALSESDLMEIVTEMTDTDDFLAKQKGLGNWRHREKTAADVYGNAGTGRVCKDRQPGRPLRSTGRFP